MTTRAGKLIPREHIALAISKRVPFCPAIARRSVSSCTNGARVTTGFEKWSHRDIPPDNSHLPLSASGRWRRFPGIARNSSQGRCGSNSSSVQGRLVPRTDAPARRPRPPEQAPPSPRRRTASKKVQKMREIRIGLKQHQTRSLAAITPRLPSSAFNAFNIFFLTKKNGDEGCDERHGCAFEW